MFPFHIKYSIGESLPQHPVLTWPSTSPCCRLQFEWRLHHSGNHCLCTWVILQPVKYSIHNQSTAFRRHCKIVINFILPNVSFKTQFGGYSNVRVVKIREDTIEVFSYSEVSAQKKNSQQQASHTMRLSHLSQISQKLVTLYFYSKGDNLLPTQREITYFLLKGR